MEKDVKLYQDNRITTARYELSLIEKRIVYLLINEIRKRFVETNSGDKTLFEDLIIKTNQKKLLEGIQQKNIPRVKEAFKSLRYRSISYDNGYGLDDPRAEGFEVGFINYSSWKNQEIEFQISKIILPFFVELSQQYTAFSAVVAMSLKSKWSQRMYELCSQWKMSGGFRMTIDELRHIFKLENKYKKYAAFKARVIEVAKKELKELFEKGESDLHFEYTEIKSGRSVTALNFKIITKQERIKLEDMDYYVRVSLHQIFNTQNKFKNKKFVDLTMQKMRQKPELLEHLYRRLPSVKRLPKNEQAKYLRFIINYDILEKGKENN